MGLIRIWSTKAPSSFWKKSDKLFVLWVCGAEGLLGAVHVSIFHQVSQREEAGSIDLWLWAFICPLITLESQNSNVSLISVSLWKLNPERPHSKIGVGPGFEFGSIDYEIEAHSAALGPLSACGLSNRISSILPSFPIWEPWVCTHLVSEGLGLSFLCKESCHLRKVTI